MGGYVLSLMQTGRIDTFPYQIHQDPYKGETS